MTNRPRNGWIDLMRAAAICPVLFTHWSYAGILSPVPAFLGDLYRHIAVKGGNGVLLFFVISGFVITRSVMARETNFFQLSIRSFYQRRLARIYPLLILITAIGMILLVSCAPGPLYDDIIRNPKATFNLTFWAAIGTYTFNIWRMINLPGADGWGLHWDLLWSLAVEEQFYVLFPLVIVLSRSRKMLFGVLAGSILSSMAYRLCHPHYSYLDSRICFELIAAGVMAAMYGPAITRFRIPIITIGSVLLGLGFFAPIHSLIGLFMQEFIAIGSAILLCSAVSIPVQPYLLLRPVTFVGELSYGMYLLHPVILFATGAALTRLGHYPGYGAYLAITVLIAVVSYRWFEQPSERWLRRLLMGRSTMRIGEAALGSRSP